MKSVLGALAGLGMIAIVAMAAAVILSRGTTVTVISNVNEGLAGPIGTERTLRIRTSGSDQICLVSGCCAERGGISAIDIEAGGAICRDGEMDEGCTCSPAQD